MDFRPLREFLDYYLPMLGIPGSDTVIYKNHKEIFRHTSGYDSLRFRTPVRENALYHVYSVTKVSTAVAATQLIERGELLASDPLYAYFPEYRDIKVKRTNPDGSVDIVPAKNALLVQHILTMTGGIDCNLNRPGILRAKECTGGRCPTLDMVKAMAEDPFDFEPGTRFQYGLCLDIVGGLVELVSGMSLGEYMKNNIFEPLGMTHTTFGMDVEKRNMLAAQYEYDAINKRSVEVPVDRNEFNFGSEYESGGAGLISSVNDQILLADALANGGVGKSGNRILSKFGVDLMRSNALDEKALPTFNREHLIGYGYGYGVRTNLNPASAGNLAPVGEFGWDGERMSYMSCDPENHLAMFHAEHIGGFNAIVHPRLRNLVYSCLGE